MKFSASIFRNLTLLCLICLAVLWTVVFDLPESGPPVDAAAVRSASTPASTGSRNALGNLDSKPSNHAPTLTQTEPLTEDEPAVFQALLSGAARIATKVEPLQETNRFRERTLWHVPSFKYHAIREEITRETDLGGAPGRIVDRQFVVADHALMKFPAGMTPGDVRAWAESKGWMLRKSMALSGIHLVAVKAQGASLLDAVETLIATFEADFPAGHDGQSAAHLAEPDGLVFASAVTPNDPSFPQLWGLHNTGAAGGVGVADADIDAPEAWEIHRGSRSVVVGVIDSGLDTTHPDLAANIWRNPGEIPGNGKDDDGNGYVDDIHGWDFYSEDAVPDDPNGHGTHVAGTIGAVGDNGIGTTGVAWAVSMAGLRFLSASGSGATSDAVEAVAYATFKKMAMTSNSWSSSSSSLALKSVIDDAGAAGILFVAAAGNNSANTDSFPRYPSAYNSWNIVSVAATTRQDKLSSFSNHGAVSVDLAAPGSDIYSTLPGGKYGLKSGTSMAAPHVTGALAVLKSYYPSFSAGELKERLLADVDKLPALDGKCVSGGRLNLHRMLQNAPGAHPVIIETAFDDAPGGNGDGIINPGETVRLRVTVMNRGIEAGSGIQLTLQQTTSSAGIHITNAVTTLDTLEAGGQTLVDDLEFSVEAGMQTPQFRDLRLTLSHGTPLVSKSQSLLVAVHTSARFAGQATDALTGEPVEGAEIRFTGPRSGSVETGPDGRYQAIVEEGVYEAWAVKAPSHAPSVKQVVALPPERSDVDFTLGQPLLQASPASLRAELFSGGTATKTLNLANHGTGMLEWSIQSGDVIRRPLVVAGRTQAKNANFETSLLTGGAAKELQGEIQRRAGVTKLIRPPVTAASLKGVGIFIVDNAMAGAAPSEWDAVLAAASSGMSVIISPRFYMGLPSKLTELTGIRRVTDSWSQDGLLITYLEHPITSGLGQMSINTGMLYAPEDGRATGLSAISGTTNRHGLVVSESGASRFAALSGGLLAGNSSNLVEQNKRIARQLLDWMLVEPAWWTASPSSGEILPGGTMEVAVQFHGQGRPGGMRTGSMLVRDSLRDSSVRVSLQMNVKSGPGLVLPREELNFPDTLVGNEKVELLPLANQGDHPLTILGMSLPVQDFQLATKLPLTLQPGEKVSLSVRFFPSAAGNFSDDLILLSNDASQPSQRIPMKAVAHAGRLLVAQNEIPILKTAIGAPVSSFFNIKNEGTAVSSFSFENVGMHGLTFAPSSGDVHPDQEIQIQVTFLPTYIYSLHTYFPNLTETVSPGVIRNVAIPMLLQSSNRQMIRVEPMELDFGEIAKGGHRERILLLRNIGSKTMSVQSLSMPVGGFSLLGGQLPFSMAAGATRTLTVLWNPPQTGAVSEAIVLTSDDPENPRVTIPVSGTAYEPPKVHVLPDSLDYTGEFGVLDGDTKIVTITNTGDAPLEWSAESEESLESVRQRLTTTSQMNILEGALPNAIPIASHAGAYFFNDWRRPSGAYYHTQLRTNLSAHAEDYLPYSSKAVAHPQFGKSGYYATHIGSKLFFFAADLGGVEEFRTAGSLYHRSNARLSNEVITLAHGGTSYTGLLMRNYSTNVSSNDCTSSLNHLIILPTSQFLSIATPASSNSVSQTVFLRPGSSSSLYHLMFSASLASSGNPPVHKTYGPFLSTADATNLMTKFLDAVGERGKASWLQVSPASGVVAPGESASVTVTASAQNLTQGSRAANIRLITNDPLQQSSRLHVQMSMRELPRLQLSAEEIGFGQLVGKSSLSKTVTVKNIGSAPLSLSSFALDGHPAFSYSWGAQALAPGASASLSLVFSPLQEGQYNATLRFSSNDPYKSQTTLALTGTATPSPYMHVTPSPLHIMVPGGTSKIEAFTLQNTGTGSFTWTASLASVPGYEPPLEGPAPLMPALSLPDILSRLNAASSTLTNLIPDRHSFTDGVTGFSIEDGGDDMYDDGNLILTNISKGAALPYSDNKIATSDVLAPAGGSYFTRKLNGLFVLAADLAVSEFRIAGNLGADGEGSVTPAVLQQTIHGRNFTGFVKRVHGAGTDPSVNHLIIVESKAGIGHDYANSTDDDAHRVFGLAGSTRLYYLLFASREGRFVTDEETGALMSTFLNMLGPSLHGAVQLLDTGGVVTTTASARLSVNAQHLAAGSYQAAVVFGSPGILTRSMPVVVEVADEPSLSVSGQSIAFPNIPRDSVIKRPLTLQNNGRKPLTVSSLTLSSEVFTFVGAAAPLTLAPGASASLEVQFAPPAAGDFAAELTIESDSFPMPVMSIPLTGKGLGRPVARLTHEGTVAQEMHFLTTQSGRVEADFMLQNTGDAPLIWSIHQPALAWRPGAATALSPVITPSSGTLQAGATAGLHLEAGTQNMEPGAHTAEIRFSTNEAQGMVRIEVPLHLQIEPGPVAILETPSLDFGQLESGSSTLVASVLNGGSTPLEISGISLPGGEFVCNAAFPLSVAAGQRAVLTIRYTPVTNKVWDAAATLFTNDPGRPALDVAIAAEGIFPGVLAVAPGSLAFLLEDKSSAVMSLNVLNTGQRSLSWNIEDNPMPALERVLEAVDEHGLQIAGNIPGVVNIPGGLTGSYISPWPGLGLLANRIRIRHDGSALAYSDGKILQTTLSQVSARYFTRRFPGLWVMAADMDEPESLVIINSFSDTWPNMRELFEVQMQGYAGFCQRIHGSGHTSLNHIMIVPQQAGLSHQYSGRVGSSEGHEIRGLTGSLRVFHLVFATAPDVNGGFVEDEVFAAVMRSFLEALPPSWLKVSPSSGALQGGGIQSVTVTVSDPGWENGVYNGLLKIRATTEPSSTSLDVPVTLSLSNSGVIQLLAHPGKAEMYALLRGDKLRVLNSSTGAETAEFALPSGTTRLTLAADGSALWGMSAKNQQIWRMTLPLADSAIESWQVSTSGYSSAGDHLAVTLSGHACVSDGRLGGGPAAFDLRQGRARARFGLPGEGHGLTGLAASRLKSEIWGWSQRDYSENPQCRLVRLPVSSSGFGKPVILPSVIESDRADARVWLTWDEKAVFAKNHRYNLPSPAAPSAVFDEVIEAITPDGSLAVGENRLFDGHTGEVLTTFSNPSRIATFSHDGSRLWRWNTQSGAMEMIVLGAMNLHWNGQPVEDALDFGVAVVGGAVQRTLTLRNLGGMALSGVSCSVEGPQASEVTLEPLPSQTLPQGGSMPCKITFRAAQEGLRSALLKVRSSDSERPEIIIQLTLLADSKAAPLAILQQPGAMLAKLGDEARLSLEAGGTGPMTFHWQKGKKRVASTREPAWSIPKVAAFHAGMYAVTVVDGRGGSSTSETAALVVYEPVSVTTKVVEGGMAQMAGRTWGDGASFQWHRDGIAIEDSHKISGSRTATLRLLDARPADAGVHTLTVSLGGAERVAAIFVLEVTELPRILNASLGPWSMGAAIHDTLTASVANVRFTASGLPPGVKLDSTTGLLSGNPVRHGDFVISARAHNQAGASPAVSLPVRVLPLPDSLKGLFVGLLQRSAFSSGGMLSLTVSSTGACSGWLQTGSDRKPLKGMVEWLPEWRQGVARFEVLNRDHTGYDLTLRLSAADSELEGDVRIFYWGKTQFSLRSEAIRGYRSPWSASNRSKNHAGYWNALIEMPEAFQGVPNYPKGTGHAQTIIRDNGMALWTAKLANGSSATASSPISSNGRACFYVMTKNDPQSLLVDQHHDITSSPTRLDGLLDWAGHSSYASYASFPSHFRVIRGDLYTPPVPGRLVLNLPVQTQPVAQFQFSQNGAFKDAQQNRLSTTLVINQRHGVTPGESSAEYKLRALIQPGSGHFNGSFTLTDEHHGGKITRASRFSGLFIERLGKGIGHYNLTRLPTYIREPAINLKLPPGSVDIVPFEP